MAVDLVEVNPNLAEEAATEMIRAGCPLVRCALREALLSTRLRAGGERGSV